MDTPLSHAWQVVFPPLQCHAHGWLDVGDGHSVYWEECGNPLGQPALFVHGGPGAGCTAADRRWFDPQKWRIVLFDQRGAGRSRPLGRLAANTTAHGVADIAALRRHLGIDRWLLFGGSWGATLALAYAQQHPDDVHALVLRGVFTATARERHWLYAAEGAAQRHTAAWQRLLAALAPAADTGLLPAMAAQLHCGDALREHTAARAWLQWEHDLMACGPPGPNPGALASESAGAATLAMARIAVHFASQSYFLAEDQLLADAARWQRIAGVIVQGEDDDVTPAAAALALHDAWPSAQLRLVAGAGHATSHPALAWELIRATEHFSNAATRQTAARRPCDTPLDSTPTAMERI